MTYLRYNLSPPLNSYIHCLYYRDRPMPYPREKILPVPWIDLMINFGGAFRAYDADQTRPFAKCDNSWFVGLRSTYHLVDWPPDMRFFTVEFKPGGAYPFLRLPLSELQHQVVTLEAIWGRYAAEIRERLYAAPTIQTRFALLERLLLARLCEVPHGFRTVQYAIAQIARQRGALSIRELSDQMGISHKHLIAQFKRLVGATPKELARMCRFQHILHSVDPTKPVDWTRIAHQCCYYDQSHFNKDFESFAGQSPTDYLRVRQRIHAEHPEHAPYLRHLSTG